jgi:DNA-binding response OmpR family regulator
MEHPLIMNERRILVIEDEEDQAKLYEMALKRMGYQVSNAFTGEEGVAEFQANGADAILLDITLPEMQGLQVLKEIRHISASVPVIVITGKDPDEVCTEGELLGIHSCFLKPVDIEKIYSTLEQAFENEKEEYRVVTLRLPQNVINTLSKIDSNLERSITKLCEIHDKENLV